MIEINLSSSSCFSVAISLHDMYKIYPYLKLENQSPTRSACNTYYTKENMLVQKSQFLNQPQAQMVQEVGLNIVRQMLLKLE